jgi:hypothetical protein
MEGIFPVTMGALVSLVIIATNWFIKLERD